LFTYTHFAFYLDRATEMTQTHYTKQIFFLT